MTLRQLCFQKNRKFGDSLPPDLVFFGLYNRLDEVYDTVVSLCDFALPSLGPGKHLGSVPGPLTTHPASGTATWVFSWVQSPSEKGRSNLFSPSDRVKQIETLFSFSD